MSTRFDRDTAVTRLSDDTYEVQIDRAWWIVRGPNGGYIAAILVRAMEADFLAIDVHSAEVAGVRSILLDHSLD